MKVRDGGATREISNIRIAAGGVLRTVRTAKVMVSGTLRTVFKLADPLVLSVTPTTVTTVTPISTVESAPVTVSLTGGLGPYTYSWSVTGAGVATITPLSPNMATTRFRATNLFLGEPEAVLGTCIVTDALGTTASISVNLNFTRFSGGPFF